MLWSRNENQNLGIAVPNLKGPIIGGEYELFPVEHGIGQDASYHSHVRDRETVLPKRRKESTPSHKLVVLSDLRSQIELFPFFLSYQLQNSLPPDSLQSNNQPHIAKPQDDKKCIQTLPVALRDNLGPIKLSVDDSQNTIDEPIMFWKQFLGFSLSLGAQIKMAVRIGKSVRHIRLGWCTDDAQEIVCLCNWRIVQFAWCSYQDIIMQTISWDFCERNALGHETIYLVIRSKLKYYVQ